ncbi:SRPBCC domain-containing protein [bacterium]|nr:SRPBCC domain-containing protein [bacterium]MCI0607150.1 SRPBCC domain-containing protein [bacterium]
MTTPGKLVIKRIIDASPEEIFDAWLNPESLRDWMVPGPWKYTEAIVDSRVSGKFWIVMKNDEREFEHTGEYKILDRPKKLAFTWISKATGMNPTLVTIELIQKGKKTELTLTHEGLSDEARESHEQGWTDIVEKLAKHFSKS